MRYLILSFLFVYTFPLVEAQNLLENPSFEDTVSGLAPTTKFSQLKYKQILVKGWYQPTGGTPDFYNSDYSYVGKGTPVHTARTGEGRVGLIFDNGGNKKSQLEKEIVIPYKSTDRYKEFLGAKLLRPLVKDSLYAVKFYMIQDKRSNYVSKNIGVYFSDTAIYYSWHFQCLEFTPQLVCNDWNILTTKDKWVCMRYIYKAKGDEQFITLGSFGREEPAAIEQFSDAKINEEIFKVELFRYSSYYYFDDFSIVNVTDTAKYYQIHSEDENSTVNNFVFLLDISNSMINAKYIEDMKRGITQMIDKLNPYDQLSLLTFDSKGKIIFEKYRIGEKEKIIAALAEIKPGGRSNINEGLKLSSEVMRNTYLRRGNNCIVLASDGTFNVAKEQEEEIKKLYALQGVTLNVIQFGSIESKELKKLAIKCGGIYQQTAHNVDALLVLQLKKGKPVKTYTSGKINKY